MSATSENSNSSKSASVEVQDGDQLSGVAPSIAAQAKAPEKIISCVSCRKRKLKCDRVKPKCGTCARLRHDCEFPERRRNPGTKRRNIKELEARLAQVETQLVSESKQSASGNSTATPGGDVDWNVMGRMDMDLDLDDRLLDPSFDVSQPGFGLPAPPPTMLGDYFGSYELISLGLQEPLPPQDMIDELNHIYFAKYHLTMPMMHKLRYYASLDRAPHMRPPICLRYAMWTVAASLTEKYSSFEGILYERARRYIQDAEMKGHGEEFVSVYYAQAWCLIGIYEASKTLFSRAWMSVGRMVRLAQMLGLHRIDGDDVSAKNILPPAKDFIELEERRRTFWAAFYGDRWASSGTGWPMVIDEADISTNLPASEESFENGVVEKTISLQEAFTTEGAPKLSSFAGVVLSAALFGRNYQHLHKKGPNERPEDLNADFWKRHRHMDNVLSNTFMFLPDHLRLPANIRDMNVVFLHMNIHSSIICLHQAAILQAKKYNIDPNFIQQSRNRNLMAAEEITNIMRLISHMDASNMNSWMGFCLFIAGGVFIHDLKSDQQRPQSLTNLEFLLLAMQAIAVRHRITNHFTAQLELDMAAAGIKDSVTTCPVVPAAFDVMAQTPSGPLAELFAKRHGMPSVVEQHNPQALSADTTLTTVIEDLTHQNVANGFGRKESVELHPTGTMPGPVPYFVTEMKRREKELDSDVNARNGSIGGITESETTSDPYCLPRAANGGTPSSDSSGSNAMQPNSMTTQYPYRQMDPSISGAKPYGIFQTDNVSYQGSPGWDMQNIIPGFDNSGQGENILQDDFSGFDNNAQPGTEFHDLIGDGAWNPGPMPE